MRYQHDINILDALNDSHGFSTGVFLTYGADLAFFEEAILPKLWQEWCRNIIVFMDADRYKETTGFLRGSIFWAGRRYILVPIAIGPYQSFHPKLYLLIGHERGRLLIGSGNLNFNGIGNNREVFTCLDWTPEDPEYQTLFSEAWKTINEVVHQWNHSHEALRSLQKAEAVSEWIKNPLPREADIGLIHPLEKSLLDQSKELMIGEDVKRITIVSPFLDDDAQTLGNLNESFKPSEIRLILQENRTMGNMESLKKLVGEGVPLQVYKHRDSNRYLHAKVYSFETKKDVLVLTGSANCTRAAWSYPVQKGNFELGLWRRGKDRSYYSSFFEEIIDKKPIQNLDDLHLVERREDTKSFHGDYVRLLDVTLKGMEIDTVFDLKKYPVGISKFQLRFSFIPPITIDLDEVSLGEQTIQLKVPHTIQYLRQSGRKSRHINRMNPTQRGDIAKNLLK